MRKLSWIMVASFLFMGVWSWAFLGHDSFGRIVHERFVGIRQHDVPCEDLPDEKTVQRVLDHNQDKIHEIQSLGRGNILVSVGDVQGRCPGKADIFIMYGSFNEGQEILDAIGSDELFGIPYTLWNT